jgi:hypothetical protein
MPRAAVGILALLLVQACTTPGEPKSSKPEPVTGRYRLIRHNGADLPRIVPVDRCELWTHGGELQLDSATFWLGLGLGQTCRSAGTETYLPFYYQGFWTDSSDALRLLPGGGADAILTARLAGTHLVLILEDPTFPSTRAELEFAPGGSDGRGVTAEPAFGPLRPPR